MFWFWKSFFKDLNVWLGRLGRRLNPQHSKSSKHETPSTKSCTGMRLVGKDGCFSSPRNRNKTPGLKKKKGGYSRVTISPAAKKRANFHVLSFKEPRSLTFSKWYLPRRSFTLLHQGLGFQEKCVDLSLDTWASAVGILPFRILTMSFAQNFAQWQTGILEHLARQSSSLLGPERSELDIDPSSTCSKESAVPLLLTFVSCITNLGAPSWAVLHLQKRPSSIRVPETQKKSSKQKKHPKKQLQNRKNWS